MSKQPVDLDKSAETLARLDSETINNIGGRCFFNDEKLGKCVATVSGFPGEKSPVVRNEHENIVSGGQMLFWFTVQHNNGGADFKVKAPFSSDGKPGTARLAEDGDLSDHVNMKKLKGEGEPAEVVEEVAPELTQTNTAPLPAPEQPAQSFHPYDKNKDGVVDKQEMKQGRKGK